VTYSTFICADSASTACSSSVLLPMPGSPPISTTPPSTMPPPSTRSSSSWPVGVRATSAGVDLAQRGHRLAARQRLEAVVLAAPLPAGSATLSSSVFQALQLRALAQPLGLVPRIRGR
jgi:hypothetical protein